MRTSERRGVSQSQPPRGQGTAQRCCGATGAVPPPQVPPRPRARRHVVPPFPASSPPPHRLLLSPPPRIVPLPALADGPVSPEGQERLVFARSRRPSKSTPNHPRGRPRSARSASRGSQVDRCSAYSMLTGHSSMRGEVIWWRPSVSSSPPRTCLQTSAVRAAIVRLPELVGVGDVHPEVPVRSMRVSEYWPMPTAIPTVGGVDEQMLGRRW